MHPKDNNINDADGRSQGRSINSRTKAKTFYGEEALEDIVNKKRFKMDLDHQTPNYNLDNVSSARRRDENIKTIRTPS